MTTARRKHDPQKPDLLELVVTAISGVLFVGILAFLLWDARQPSLPPSFETAIESRVQQGSSVYVTVAVRNVGDEAARTVEVRVRSGEAATEAHFTLDWLPGRSIRRGVAVFPQGTALDGLRAEVAGYAKP